MARNAQCVWNAKQYGACRCEKCDPRMWDEVGSSVPSNRIVHAVAEPKREEEVVSVGKGLTKVERKVETSGQISVTWDGSAGVPLDEIRNFVNEAEAAGVDGDDLIKYDREIVTVGSGPQSHNVHRHGFFAKIETVPAYASSKPRRRFHYDNPRSYVKPAVITGVGVGGLGVVALLWNIVQFFLGTF